MEVVDLGHVYLLDTFGKNGKLKRKAKLRFIKRSGGAITHPNEHPGLNTQEVLRALIERSEFLDDVLECDETKDAIYHLRMALYMYELRAWRRKQEKVNKLEPAHDDSERPRPWREHPHEAPFSEHMIEERETGDDGHIIL